MRLPFNYGGCRPQISHLLGLALVDGDLVRTHGVGDLVDFEAAVVVDVKDAEDLQCVA